MYFDGKWVTRDFGQTFWVVCTGKFTSAGLFKIYVAYNRIDFGLAQVGQFLAFGEWRRADRGSRCQFRIDTVSRCTLSPRTCDQTK